MAGSALRLAKVTDEGKKKTMPRAKHVYSDAVASCPHMLTAMQSLHEHMCCEDLNHNMSIQRCTRFVHPCSAIVVISAPARSSLS